MLVASDSHSNSHRDPPDVALLKSHSASHDQAAHDRSTLVFIVLSVPFSKSYTAIHALKAD